MQKKIIIISSGHPSMDERIFWKFGLSLSGNGYKVQITTSVEELNIVKENITINSFDGLNITKREKINRFYSIIKEFDADLIICCEPFPILAAHKFRKEKRTCKIISDITEWYPYSSHYRVYTGLKKFTMYAIHFLFNVYVSNLVDHLIISEKLKAKPYKIFAPLKKQTVIGHYPPKIFFNFHPVTLKTDQLTICFAGSFIEERGFNRILLLSNYLAEKFPSLKINLLLIGDFESESEKEWFNNFPLKKNVIVQLKERVSYNLYNELLAEADICIDLRSKTRMRDKSIPIKIFDYMACGKPVIFSNVKAFNDFPEIPEFGHLVQPDDYQSILRIIEKYLRDPALLSQHSLNARRLFEEKFNWEISEKVLLKVIEDLIPA